jgi:hypothetical protein
MRKRLEIDIKRQRNTNRKLISGYRLPIADIRLTPKLHLAAKTSAG